MTIIIDIHSIDLASFVTGKGEEGYLWFPKTASVCRDRPAKLTELKKEKKSCCASFV